MFTAPAAPYKPQSRMKGRNFFFVRSAVYSWAAARATAAPKPRKTLCTPSAAPAAVGTGDAEVMPVVGCGGRPVRPVLRVVALADPVGTPEAEVGAVPVGKKLERVELPAGTLNDENDDDEGAEEADADDVDAEVTVTVVEGTSLTMMELVRVLASVTEKLFCARAGAARAAADKMVATRMVLVVEVFWW